MNSNGDRFYYELTEEGKKLEEAYRRREIGYTHYNKIKYKPKYRRKAYL